MRTVVTVRLVNITLDQQIVRTHSLKQTHDHWARMVVALVGGIPTQRLSVRTP